MRIYHTAAILFTTIVSVLSQDRPNVIFVMPDDISHNAFSYFNASGPRTPNIDKLANTSVRLTDFHVSPTCSPTRGALMTGRFNDVVGVWHTIYGRNQLRKDEITMADVFKANGYATGLFFKWHLGDNYPFRPKDRGFEYVAWTKGGGTGQQPDYWGNQNDRASAWVNDSLVKMTDEDDGIEGAFLTNFFFNRAMEFMEENIKKDKPFFAYIPTATAHSPHYMPPDARSGIKALTATIENIDKNMGRLIQFLDDKGIANNTILVFTTDNGSSTHLRGGKGSHYDGGTRVPCFVRWPDGNLGGVGKGRDVTPLTAHIDWLPTFMDTLDFKDVSNRPEKLKMHGRSFKTFLDTDASNDPSEYKNRAVTIVNMRTENVEKFRALSVKKDIWEGDAITHKWRLVRHMGDESNWELYDALEDEKQENDVIGNSANAPIVKELKAEYEKWWALVKERSDEYTRIIIGHPAEPVTRINSHDSHNASPWHQGHVANGSGKTNFMAIEFEKSGNYHFDLRRWPEEVASQSTLTTVPKGKVFNGNIPKPIAIVSASLKIYHGNTVYFEGKKAADAASDGVAFSVNNLPKGPAFIETQFYGSDGKVICPVFFTYARPD
ncbi:MAG: sulfatase-like hydrolase/transferase [Verrucomicrobia bacterium]|jgi:arylsulfatase A-like enzyme|nr:sulfatase-like hydrolase/transferase [Verrucomicrobiota bacterium]